MKAQIDGHYVAAQIRLVRQVHKGTILILEGESDGKVFDRFIDGTLCDIEIAFGKENAIEALDLLEEEGFPGVLAVVDADFDRITKIKYTLENLCMTDLHDLDLTIFGTKALELYMKEHVDKRLLKTEFKNDFLVIRNKLVTASLPLAYCRFVAESRSLRLYFKSLRHEQFVTADDLSMDSDALIGEIISRSNTPCTVAQLKTYVANEAAKEHDPYQLANGHDVAAILGIALRKLLANRGPAQTWASEIEAGLRLAFDWEAIKGTQLYKCLKGWEANNRNYRIFRHQSA
jgi:hypothetical protein